MSIKHYLFPYGMLQENTYLVIDEASGDKAIVDPGCITDTIRELIGNADSLKYLILTHAHGDHIMSVPEYVAEYPDVKIIIGIEDEESLRNATENGSRNMGHVVEASADITVSDGSSFMLGDSRFDCIFTPGHTRGGICYLSGKTMYSGDTLFFRSVGATHFPGGSWEQLEESIRNKLFTLEDDIVVYPGHGPETTIGFEKQHNPYV